MKLSDCVTKLKTLKLYEKLLIIVIAMLISGFVTAQEAKQGAKLPSVNVKTLEGETFNIQI